MIRAMFAINLLVPPHLFDPRATTQPTNQHKGTSRRQGPYDAVEWAAVRGHTEMAALLRRRIAQLQQQLERKNAGASVGGGAPAQASSVRDPAPGVEEQRQEQGRDAMEDGTEGGGGKGKEAEMAPMTAAARSPPPPPTPPMPSMPYFGITSPGWMPMPAAAAVTTAAALASYATHPPPSSSSLSPAVATADDWVEGDGGAGME